MIKLNLASHGDNMPGYINVDFDHPSADLKADVSALPFEDNSVDEIYASHILEHFRAGNAYEHHLSNPLNPKTATDALNEWRRVLKPGGKLELKLPDFEKIVWLYYNFPQWARADGANGPFANYSDWLCSAGQHQLIADKSVINKLLKLVGFQNIEFLDGIPKAFVDRSNLEMHVTCQK